MGYWFYRSNEAMTAVSQFKSLFVLILILTNYRNIMFIQTVYACFFTAVWVAILNSFLNPIVYAVRLRQFRVAFVDLRNRTANIAGAEEIRMRVLGSTMIEERCRRSSTKARKSLAKHGARKCEQHLRCFHTKLYRTAERQLDHKTVRRPAPPCYINRPVN